MCLIRLTHHSSGAGLQRASHAYRQPLTFDVMRRNLRSFMFGINIKGIVLGILAVIAIDILGGIIALPIFEKEFYFLVWGVFSGTIATIVGGYVAAKYSGASPYINSFIIGAIGVLIGIVIEGDYPLWFDLIGYTTVIPAALFGGYIFVRKIA